MKSRALAISGSWVIDLYIHSDARGSFEEWFRADVASQLLGRNWVTAQANTSHSHHGVIRGVHYALVPPGQAKWVTCVAGAIRDFVIDIRPDSPTYGQHEEVPLSATAGRCVLISEGLGHAFVVDSETATVSYLLNAPYQPDREFGINVFDPDLRLPWNVDNPVVSDRDREAPTLAEAQAMGRLPTLAAYHELSSTTRD